MRTLVTLLGLATATPAFAWPVHVEGTMCDPTIGLCGDMVGDLNANGTGTMTLDVLGFVLQGPLDWRADPARGLVQLRFQGMILRGRMGGGCASGANTVVVPPPYQPLLGATLDVAWELCR